MHTTLVRAGIRWSMEAAGIAVGEMEIIKLNTGQKTTYKIDGTVIKEQNPISINWCDKCESWKPLEYGRYEGAQGLTMLWICMECK